MTPFAGFYSMKNLLPERQRLVALIAGLFQLALVVALCAFFVFTSAEAEIKQEGNSGGAPSENGGDANSLNYEMCDKAFEVFSADETPDKSNFKEYVLANIDLSVVAGKGCLAKAEKYPDYAEDWTSFASYILDILEKNVSPAGDSTAESAGAGQSECEKLTASGLEAAKNNNFDLALEKFLQNRKCILEINGNTENEMSAVALMYMSQIFEIKGDYTHAIRNLRRALGIAVTTIGENTEEASIVYNNLGNALRESGDYDRAIENLEKALNIKISILGENNASVATTYNNIGASYSGKSDFDKALEYYQKALEIRIAVLGAENADTASSYNNIGELYRENGKPDKALENLKKALDIYTKLYGENSSELLVIYSNLGLVYTDLEEYDTALDYLFRTLDLSIDTLGSNNNATAAIYDSISKVYSAQGKTEDAEKYHDKAESLYR